MVAATVAAPRRAVIVRWPVRAFVVNPLSVVRPVTRSTTTNVRAASRLAATLVLPLIAAPPRRAVLLPTRAVLLPVRDVLPLATRAALRLATLAAPLLAMLAVHRLVTAAVLRLRTAAVARRPAVPRCPAANRA